MLSRTSTLLIQHVRRATLRWYCTKPEYPGLKTCVEGYDIHYEQVGEGNHVVLLLPGAAGSSRTDFAPQLDGGLDRKKFTLVAWDPPGYGYSRPPERTFPKDYLARDARLVAALMSRLGHTRYSTLGWSDGATTAIHLAAHEPQNVRSMVIWGGGVYLTLKDLKAVESTRNVENWSARMRAPMEALYGPERFRSLWEEYCNAWKNFGTTKSSVLEGNEQGGSGDLALGDLTKVTCPTFVIHGDLDPMIDPVHHTHLAGYIKGAKLHKFKDGKHNLHLRYAKEFNTLVQDFLSSH